MVDETTWFEAKDLCLGDPKGLRFVGESTLEGRRTAKGDFFTGFFRLAVPVCLRKGRPSQVPQLVPSNRVFRTPSGLPRGCQTQRMVFL